MTRDEVVAYAPDVLLASSNVDRKWSAERQTDDFDPDPTLMQWQMRRTSARALP
jgi:hypothetical protein